MQKIQIYIDDIQSKKLKHLAVDLEISLSELMRRLTKTYLENPDHAIFKPLGLGRKNAGDY